MPVTVQLSFLPKKEKKKERNNSRTVGPQREVGGSFTIGNFDVGEMEMGQDGLNLSSIVLRW